MTLLLVWQKLWQSANLPCQVLSVTRKSPIRCCKSIVFKNGVYMKDNKKWCCTLKITTPRICFQSKCITTSRVQSILTPSFAKVVQHSEMEKLANNLNPTERYPGCLFGQSQALQGALDTRVTEDKPYLCIEAIYQELPWVVVNPLFYSFTLLSLFTTVMVKFEIFSQCFKHL